AADADRRDLAPERTPIVYDGEREKLVRALTPTMAGGAADADRRDLAPERTPIVYDGEREKLVRALTPT
ncbi:hypothetical protein CK247_31485, partial [Klebsiella pneumoniae]